VSAIRSGPAGVSRGFLLLTQVRHEAQLKYIGSVAGLYWTILNPIIQVGAYVFVVTVVFDAPLTATEGGRLDYAVFVLAGMSTWLAMQDGLISSAGSFVRHSEIVRNVVFPLELLPIAAVIVSLLSLAVSLTALVVIDIAGGRDLVPSVLSFPLVLAVQLVFTIGVGLALAVMTTFVRDLLYLLPVLFQVLTLFTPIFYSIDALPGSLQTIARLNPIYQLVDSYQRIFFEGTWPSWGGLAYAAIVSVALFVAGRAMFRALKGYAEALV